MGSNCILLKWLGQYGRGRRGKLSGAAIDVFCQRFIRMNGVGLQFLLEPFAVIRIAEKRSVPLSDSQLCESAKVKLKGVISPVLLIRLDRTAAHSESNHVIRLLGAFPKLTPGSPLTTSCLRHHEYEKGLPHAPGKPLPSHEKDTYGSVDVKDPRDMLVGEVCHSFAVLQRTARAHFWRFCCLLILNFCKSDGNRNSSLPEDAARSNQP